MLRGAILTFLVYFLILPSSSIAQETRLLRNPDISESHIAFVYSNDIWVAKLSGGEARRLTSFQGAETEPHFSPDGKLIAFSGQYDGNTDVYVVPTTGGEPKRLTWHPIYDVVRGWTNDGEYIVFASGRENAPINYPKLWKVSLKGSMPIPLPIPRVAEGKFSLDDKKFVYQKIWPWESEWRNYRGGQNNPIRIIDLNTLEVEKLPWDGANDNTPMWMNNKIFFLSDRDYVMNIWSYELDAKKLKQETYFKDFDCKNLEAGGGKLIFENSGYLYIYDPAAGKPEKLSVAVRGDFPWARTHWKTVGDQIVNRSLSPTGKRAVFEARGDIFTVPEKKGDIRNLTSSSGTADRNPIWSPDGKYISWFSDEGGEYHLVIADQYGSNKETIALENPTFYYTPAWSPDCKYLSFGDADRNLWIVNIDTKKISLIDNEGFTHPERTIYPEWSPDSKWIAYTKRLINQYNAIFIYSLEKNKSFQLTDGLSDCKSPAWDAGGKYIYFLASTNYGLNVGWLDLSSLERPVRRAIYLAVLSSKEPSPLLPESDDEIGGEEADDESKDEEKKGKNKDDEVQKKRDVEVQIDFEGIDQRVIALDVPARDYRTLKAGKEGTIFYLEGQQNEETLKLHRYIMKDREAKEILQGVVDYSLSADGEKLLYSKGPNQWAVADANGQIKADEGKINTEDMRMKVDPPEEWKQIFREAWRYQRDYFYVDNVHGLDLEWAYSTYAPWVEHVRHRADLTYVLDILGGETAIGHSFTGGGDWPNVERTPVGMLGADFAVEDGRFRIKKIYSGENWNPELRAPLSGPGIDVKEGDYLLAVNGIQLDSGKNLYAFFEHTAEKQTSISVNDKPTMKGCREVTVVPINSETALRRRAWIENNRRKVDELSNGKLAYVWLPNTSVSGYTSFNRYYFAQKDKKGAVIDERFNGGGYIADYIVDLLSRELLGYFNNPIGDRQPFTAPNAAIWGPKVMIINDAAGSGGDFLPYMFRLKGIGPLVGTRTWGGLVGIWDVPPLVDGGYITAPRGGFYNLQGEWDVENEGVKPDVEVEQEPKLVNEGHDPQLEEAVRVALELLETQGIEILPQPQDPIRVKRPEN
ncbi:MAG: protease [Candidatus Latescibacteria bacterium]|nr:protease [Candidatus Latescibacterota bacterium]NIO27130.1 protease [Candidatus Latescibacterota bacterium]NIO54654.1 protease [Candidatus Latescibacterota bacterium]NIT00737.1 protease [Candidatus Latescibacterota bacterium]NIT37660.1 protease [Candidatus Latescibacterota bacterium]